MNKILIAIDGSPSAREATRFGIVLAREAGAQVTFVHVIAAPPEGVAVGPAGPFWDWPKPKHYALLHEAAELAAFEGVTARTQLLAGKTVDEIVACADSIDADLIVVGSRGRGSIRTALLGSTSLGALHEARRPVVVVGRAGVGMAAADLAVASVSTS
jgi:nucleotide-binding universal stress UspA family protein